MHCNSLIQNLEPQRVIHARLELSARRRTHSAQTSGRCQTTSKHHQTDKPEVSERLRLNPKKTHKYEKENPYKLEKNKIFLFLVFVDEFWESICDETLSDQTNCSIFFVFCFFLSLHEREGTHLVLFQARALGETTMVAMVNSSHSHSHLFSSFQFSFRQVSLSAPPSQVRHRFAPRQRLNFHPYSSCRWACIW